MLWAGHVLRDGAHLTFIHLGRSATVIRSLIWPAIPGVAFGALLVFPMPVKTLLTTCSLAIGHMVVISRPSSAPIKAVLVVVISGFVERLQFNSCGHQLVEC